MKRTTLHEIQGVLIDKGRIDLVRKIISSANFKIGTKFIRRNSKRQDIETITDIYTTKNIKGKIVKITYVASHNFMGTIIHDYDILAPTIARSKIIK